MGCGECASVHIVVHDSIRALFSTLYRILCTVYYDDLSYYLVPQCFIKSEDIHCFMFHMGYGFERMTIDPVTYIQLLERILRSTPVHCTTLPAVAVKCEFVAGCYYEKKSECNSMEFLAAVMRRNDMLQYRVNQS